MNYGHIFKHFDILFINETKLDSSFSQAQFHVPGYRSFRKDRTGRGRGILAYVRSNLYQHESAPTSS